MRQLVSAVLVTVSMALIFPATSQAGTLSKGFIFKTDVVLEIGLEITEDLVLDTIKFKVPDRSSGGRFLPGGLTRTGRVPTVEVAISNRGHHSSRVGIAVSLYDEEGMLVGVASGGSRLMPVRSDEQVTHILQFKHVNSRIAGAARFHVTVETR